MKTVLSCAEMRAADAYTIQKLGVPSQVLMERAGARHRRGGGQGMLHARAAAGVWSPSAAGGNNGGDGWCAARILSLRRF